MKRLRHFETRGFTLVEVILAVGISLGLMVVVLSFYRLVTQWRTDVLEQTERVTVVRRVMDRLTAELRTAVPHEYLPAGMMGDSNYIMFARAEMPAAPGWLEEWPRGDLRVITYGLATGSEMNTGGGLTRTEEALPSALWEYVLDETAGLGEVEGEEESTAEAWSDPGAAILTDQIHYLRFRYWNGWWWQDAWERLDLPLGVEVSLGIEPLPAETESGLGAGVESESGVEVYPYELFRRVIYLPSNEAPTGLSVFDLLDVPDEGGVEEEAP